MTKNIDFLKEVLSIPTQTYKEDLMVEYLMNWLEENNIPHYKDDYNNVYATKQETEELPEDFYFPCVISHTDTVHEICHLGELNHSKRFWALVAKTIPNFITINKELRRTHVKLI